MIQSVLHKLLKSQTLSIYELIKLRKKSEIQKCPGIFLSK